MAGFGANADADWGRGVHYSGRRQLVFPTTGDKLAAEASLFEKKKKKSCIVLPPIHSYSVRVRRVTDKILRGMEKWLEAEGGGNMITKQLEGLKWEVVVVADRPELELPAF